MGENDSQLWPMGKTRKGGDTGTRSEVVVFGILPIEKPGEWLIADQIRRYSEKAGFTTEKIIIQRGDWDLLNNTIVRLSDQKFELAIVLIHCDFERVIDEYASPLGITQDPGTRMVFDRSTDHFQMHPLNTPDFFARIFPAISSAHKLMVTCYSFNDNILSAVESVASSAKCYIGVKEDLEVTGEMATRFIEPFFEFLSGVPEAVRFTSKQIYNAYCYAKSKPGNNVWHCSLGLEFY